MRQPDDSFGKIDKVRERIARRAALELKNGMYGTELTNFYTVFLCC